MTKISDLIPEEYYYWELSSGIKTINKLKSDLHSSRPIKNYSVTENGIGYLYGESSNDGELNSCRLATQEERDHLNACIAANKYVEPTNIDYKNWTHEQIVEKIYKDYSIGTNFIPAHAPNIDTKFVVKGYDFKYGSYQAIIDQKRTWEPNLFYNGQWAKIVPKVEEMKSSQNFMIGDIIVRESGQNLRSYIGNIEKVINVLTYSINTCIDNGNEPNNYRLSLFSEREAYNKGCRNIKNIDSYLGITDTKLSVDDLLALAKKDYPEGTIFDSTGGTTNCIIRKNPYFEYDGYSIKVFEDSSKIIFIGRVYEVSSKKWAKIISHSNTTKINEEEFKIGDWVVVLKEDSCYSNCEKECAQQIDSIKLNRSLPYYLKFSNGGTNSYSKIRKATQKEIKEKQNVDKYIKAIEDYVKGNSIEQILPDPLIMKKKSLKPKLITVKQQ